jgi:hypothetical protein
MAVREEEKRREEEEAKRTTAGANTKEAETSLSEIGDENGIEGKRGESLTQAWVDDPRRRMPSSWA